MSNTDHENWDQVYADWMASQIDEEAFQRDFEEEEFLREFKRGFEDRFEDKKMKEEHDGVQD